ncbi:MAG: metalloregulator ArsR/SmtB family transcription factor [Bacteroidia bacterium]
MNTLLYNSTYTRKMLRMAEILRTMAHPVRLDLLKLLKENDQMNVSAIQERLDCGCEQSMLSHHLNKMKDKGIVTSVKDGKFIYYTIEDELIKDLLNCIDKETSE